MKQRTALNRSVSLLALWGATQVFALALDVPVFAQQDLCQGTIARIKSDIEDRIGGKIAYLNYRPSALDNSPTARRDYVSFELGMKREGPEESRSQSQANENILSSSVLIREYAQSVMRNCENVASVKIGLMWSGAARIYSYHSDGQIKEDECLAYRDYPNLDYRHLKWGVRVCS